MFRKIKNYIMNLFNREDENSELDYVNYHDAYMSQLINNKQEEKTNELV
jgi:hypothetical protein